MKNLLIIAMCFISLPGLAQLEPVRVKDKWGFKDHKTGKTIPVIYDEVNDFKDEEALVRKGSMYQLIDTKGKKLVDLPYPGVKYFRKGEYVFKSDSVWGMVSSAGQVLARMNYDELHHNGVMTDIYVARKGNKIGIFSSTEGLILPMEYECDEFMNVFCWDGDLFFGATSPLTLKHNGKWGVMEMRGKIILSFDYDHLKPASGYLKEAKGYLGVVKNGKCGLMDYQGQLLIPFEFDAFLGQYDNRQHSVSDPYVFMKNGKIVFYDLAAKKIIDRVPQQADFQSSECCVLSKEGKKGVIDTLGTILIPFAFEKIEVGGGKFYNAQNWPTCRVYQGNTCGLYIPGEGPKTPMLECNNIEYGMVDNKGYYIRSKGDECALLDSDLKVITKFDFRSLSFLQNKIVTFDKDGIMGVVNLDGKITWETSPK
jgi:hypothetical protein